MRVSNTDSATKLDGDLLAEYSVLYVTLSSKKPPGPKNQRHGG
jgi:hypothetical protein